MSFRIRTQIMLFVAAVLSPFAAGIGWSLHDHIEFQRRQALDNALDVARLVTSRIDDNIDALQRLLLAVEVAVRPELDSGDRLDDTLRSLHAGLPPYFGSISVLAPDGRMIGSAVVPPESRRDANFADRPQFRKAVETRSVAIGAVTRARLADDEWIVAAMRPVLGSDGQVRALVSIALRLSRIQELLLRENTPPGSVITVVDQNGTILARSLQPEKWIGQDLSAEPSVRVARRDGIFTGEVQGRDGVTRLVGMTRAREVPWLVDAGIPTGIALAAARTQTRRLVIYAVVTLVLALALAWALSRAIAHPIRRLSVDAERLAAGDFGHRSDVTSRGEAGMLAANFNRMAETLERNLGRLRDSERTLRLFVTHVPSAIAMFDRDMRHIAFSKRWLLDYRLGDRDLAGLCLYEVFPDLPERWREAHAKCLEGEVQKCEEDRWPRADGSLEWIRWEMRPWRTDDGGVGGIILFTEVITERKRDADRLRAYAAEMRALSRALSELEDKERRAIHRELHDRIGSNLTALKLDLDMLASSRDGGPVADRLQRARALLSDTIAQIRDLMAELRPVGLDDFGLLAALHAYASGWAQRLDIAVSVAGTDPPQFPAAAETAFFRIAQEALNNIAKHARAHHVAIRLESSEDRVTMVIADDGIGFDAARTHPPRPSWGMKTMRERAQAVGAELLVESEASRGTCVTVVWSRDAV